MKRLKKLSKTAFLNKVKSLEKKLLREKWKEIQKQLLERDNNKCVFCKKKVGKHFQSMHILPREFEETRYDLNNLLLGCYSCHKASKYSMHQNPLFVVEFIKKNYPERYEYLLERMKVIENNEKAKKLLDSLKESPMNNHINKDVTTETSAEVRKHTDSLF